LSTKPNKIACETCKDFSFLALDEHTKAKPCQRGPNGRVIRAEIGIKARLIEEGAALIAEVDRMGQGVKGEGETPSRKEPAFRKGRRQDVVG